MLKRAHLAQGDRGGSAVITQGLKNVTCANPPPRVHIATIGMSTYCSACQQTGYIAPRGRRHAGTGPNGKQWALSGDINICGCNPHPVFYADRKMYQTFTSYADAHVQPNRGPSSFSADKDLPYDELIVLQDEEGNPVEGLRYRITTETGDIYEGVSSARGETTRVFSDKPIYMDIELI